MPGFVWEALGHIHPLRGLQFKEIESTPHVIASDDLLLLPASKLIFGLEILNAIPCDRYHVSATDE